MNILKNTLSEAVPLLSVAALISVLRLIVILGFFA